MAGEITRFRPGQSGNPRGGSEKLRRRRRLREALDAILADEIPEELLTRVSPEVRALLPDGVTFAEMQALRLAMIAATGKPGEVLAATAQILGAQAKPDREAPQAKPEPPRLPPTEERRRDVAAQLGVDLDSEPDPTVH